MYDQVLSAQPPPPAAVAGVVKNKQQEAFAIKAGHSPHAAVAGPDDKEMPAGSYLVSRDGVPNVSELLKLMRSPVADERLGALELLAGVVDNTFGEDGVELGSVVRAGGGVAALSRLLLDPAAEIQQQALFVLGNLCSDSVDRDSSRTKSALLDCGGARIA